MFVLSGVLSDSALVVINWRGVECRSMMRLGYTVKRAKIKGQVSSIWAKWCIFDDCVLSDSNTPPWWREKVILYYYHLFRSRTFTLRNCIDKQVMMVVWE